MRQGGSHQTDAFERYCVPSLLLGDGAGLALSVRAGGNVSRAMWSSLVSFIDRILADCDSEGSC